MSQRSNVLSLLPVVFLSLSAQLGTAHAGSKGVVSPQAVFDGCAKPHYPAAALARKAQGTVTLALQVDETGTVVDSKVKKSSKHADLDEAARVAIAKCQFTPGTRDGKAIKEWAHVQYVWTL